MPRSPFTLRKTRSQHCSAKNAGRNRVTSFEQFLLSSQENKREVEWDLEITKTKDRVLPLVERAIERYSPIAVHATLEIQDAGGQRAKYTEVKAVKVLKDQPGPIFFIPLSPEGKTGNFKCKYGKIKRVLLTSQQEKFLEINLSPSPKKEQERSFEVSCDFADSFTKEVEYWDWPFSRSEPCDLTFDILFPAERPCQKWEVLRMSQSGEILEQENTGPLTRISFQKRLQSSVQYRVRWTW